MTIRLPSLNSLFAALATWRQRSRARRALAQLDPRVLRDVGIDPGLAAFEAAQPFWRPHAALRDLPHDGPASGPDPANDIAAIPARRAPRQRHIRIAAAR